ncbi:MAG: hypothetical protein ACRD03_15665 [Acidimicrobiales bacterium]
MSGPAGEAFLRTLARPVPPLEIDVDDDALTALAAVVDAGGIVLVGETHGVAENAAVLSWIVRRLGAVQIGLEWKPSAVEALWRYVHEGSLDVSQLRPSADGRITPQHFVALRKLCEDELVVGVVPFAPVLFAMQGDDPSQNAWERALADALLRLRHSRVGIVAMAGLIHAVLDPQPLRGPDATPIGRMFASQPAFEKKDTFYPMGWHVAQAIPAASVRVRYGGGTYANFGKKSFFRDPAIAKSRLGYREQELCIELCTGTAAPVPDD